MQINITGHQVELTDSLNEYIQNKFEKLERHFDNITNAQITLTVEKTRQKVDGEVHVAGGVLFASDEQEDMYAAIDGLIDKLDRQIIKHKEKMKTHK